MGNRSTRAWRTAAIAVLVAGLLAGCSRRAAPSPQRDRLVAELADALREQALAVEDPARRERLVTGLIQLRDLVSPDSVLKASVPPAGDPDLPEPPGGKMPAPEWATLFAPRSLVIGFFTQSKNFDEVPGPDGLEVRLQPLDQFGDPTKAVGSYRVEVFQQRIHTGEERGGRLGHWFVSVLDAEANRRYYDPVDRSYVFPLLWDREIPPGTPVIVQATYYPPGGFTEKLFAQRLIRIGGPAPEADAGADATADEAG
jgi:hypothetical protein